MPTISPNKTVRVSVAAHAQNAGDTVAIPDSRSYTKFLIAKTGLTTSGNLTVIAVMSGGVEAVVAHMTAAAPTGTNSTTADANTQILQVELMAPAPGGIKFSHSTNVLIGTLTVSMSGSLHSQGLN